MDDKERIDQLEKLIDAQNKALTQLTEGFAQIAQAMTTGADRLNSTRKAVLSTLTATAMLSNGSLLDKEAMGKVKTELQQALEFISSGTKKDES